MAEAVNRKEMIRQYKQTPRDMGVVGVRGLEDGSVVLMPSTDVQGAINKYDFAKKTDSVVALPSVFHDIVKRLGFDGCVLEVVQLIDPKPEATTQERMEELELLYEILMDKNKAE